MTADPERHHPSDRPVRRVAYGPDPSQHVEVTPAGHGAGPEGPGGPGGTAVLIHGGYWRQRYGLDLMDPLVAHLAGREWHVVNIEYRRLPGGPDDPAPDDPGPGLWDELSGDVGAALAVATGSGTGGRRPLVVIGHSAGGQLALWAATRAELGVDAVVALAPVADLVAADRLSLSGGVVRRLLGGGVDDVPARYRAASPQGLVPLGVPLYVVHGTADDAVPIELSRALAETARAAGDEVTAAFPDGVDHFHVIDPAHPVWRPIDRWLDARRHPAGPAPAAGPDVQ